MKDNQKKKKACQAENPKRQSRQKLGSKKKKRKEKKRKEARQAENPKRRSRQKLGPKKRRRRRKEKIGKPYQVGNLRMQPKKRRILQDESLEV